MSSDGITLTDSEARALVSLLVTHILFVEYHRVFLEECRGCIEPSASEEEDPGNSRVTQLARLHGIMLAVTAAMEASASVAFSVNATLLPETRRNIRKAMSFVANRGEEIEEDEGADFIVQIFKEVASYVSKANVETKSFPAIEEGEFNPLEHKSMLGSLDTIRDMVMSMDHAAFASEYLGITVRADAVEDPALKRAVDSLFDND